jgi:hypothetical protein
MAARFAKAPAGNHLYINGTKMVSAKRGVGPVVPALPDEKTSASWFREARRRPRAQAKA